MSSFEKVKPGSSDLKPPQTINMIYIGNERMRKSKVTTDKYIIYIYI